MKKRLLLFGKNTALMEVFFTHMRENFENLSCSSRTEDLMNHLKLVKPDALVYCLNRETQEVVNQVLACRGKLEEDAIPLIIIGADADCDFFNRYAADAAALTITRPFTASTITERLLEFFQGRPGGEDGGNDEVSPQQMRELIDESTPSVYGSRKHVLVVDDDARILKLIKEYLHEEYDVSTALNGRVAMKFLERRSVDLILLDYEMPDEKGPEILQKLHANDATRRIPVFFLTGIMERGKIAQALAQKPQGYLLKPIDRNKLLETIEKCIG